MHIRQATLEDLEAILPLFDGYRQFYKQNSDLEGAKDFLSLRLQRNESVIFVAGDMAPKTSVSSDGMNFMVGFTQLYPLFSSVSMEPMWLLNDLYVDPDHRGQGVGKLLLDKAKAFCKETAYKGLALQTASDNPAQMLYEREGFQRDTDFHYFWPAH